MSYKKVFIHLSVLLLVISLLPVSLVRAQEAPADEEPDSGAVVCPPGVYFSSASDCLPLGPSTYLTEMAKLGLDYPPRPLPIKKPDPALAQLPYRYFKLEEDTVPIRSGPGGDPTGQAFLPGFVYVSYVDRVDTGHGIYYMLASSCWIPGKGSRIGEYSSFRTGAGVYLHAKK